VARPYTIAVPSSNRATTFRDKTLAVLIAGGVDPARVTVWVPDHDQAEHYDKVLGGTVHIRAGHGRGVRQARNAIATGYPTGTDLVCLDDDIAGFYQCIDREQPIVPMTDLHGFITRAIDTADGHLWCVYPVANAYFMHPTRVRRGGLWYAEGAVMGWRVTRDYDRELVTLDDKEDFERSCRFYLTDGEVVRFDSITFKSRFYKEPGGMQDYRTAESVKVGALRLAAMYPDLATAYRARSGWWEVRLRDRRRTRRPARATT
jgi:hypothetical protein